jgi:hypothetical protein
MQNYSAKDTKDRITIKGDGKFKIINPLMMQSNAVEGVIEGWAVK